MKRTTFEPSNLALSGFWPDIKLSRYLSTVLGKMNGYPGYFPDPVIFCRCDTYWFMIWGNHSSPFFRKIPTLCASFAWVWCPKLFTCPHTCKADWIFDGLHITGRGQLWKVLCIACNIMISSINLAIGSITIWSSIHYLWPFLLVVRSYGMDSYFSVCCDLVPIIEATTITTSDVSYKL